MLGAALLVGAASSASAAANPFSDVPAEHWAYDAVAQLAADGVIEGYGDDSFRGGRNITRYEMSQMVARAMAKEGLSDKDRALLDKLVAEFNDELESLGVRVAALERNADNFKFGGQFRYRYLRRDEFEPDSTERKTMQYFTLRLEPEMRLNDHWAAHMRVDFNTDANDSKNGVMTSGEKGTPENVDYAIRLDRAWVQGDYDDFQVLLGKIPYKTFVDEGLLMDASMSGGQVTFGNKVKSTLTFARANQQYRPPEMGDDGLPEAAYTPANYQGVEVYNDRNDRLTWGVGFHHFENGSTTNDKNTMGALGTSHMRIWTLGLGWQFDKNWRLHGAGAWNTAGSDRLEEADEADSEPPVSNTKLAWSMQLDYRGAKPADKGSWGAYAAYRRLGTWGTWIPTYEIDGVMEQNNMGWEFGVSYAPLKNAVVSAKYFRGKGIDETEDINAIFAEANMFF